MLFKMHSSSNGVRISKFPKRFSDFSSFNSIYNLLTSTDTTEAPLWPTSAVVQAEGLKTGSTKSASQRAMVRSMQVTLAIFASVFFLWMVQGLGGQSFGSGLSLNYRYKLSPAILKGEMILGMSINGTTSLPGHSPFTWDLTFKFSYKSA